jgi:hypothetical protein
LKSSTVITTCTPAAKDQNRESIVNNPARAGHLSDADAAPLFVIGRATCARLKPAIADRYQHNNSFSARRSDWHPCQRRFRLCGDFLPLLASKPHIAAPAGSAQACRFRIVHADDQSPASLSSPSGSCCMRIQGLIQAHLV